jgi:tetratricopeptide (TPR) repeat protein/flagellar biosynthesis GTPase FlhF
LLAVLIASIMPFLAELCSSIAAEVGKEKTLSFLEEQGEPIINHHLERALVRALAGSLIEQLKEWRETPEGKQNKLYIKTAIEQLNVISNETWEKNKDWTTYLENFSNSASKNLEKLEADDHEANDQEADDQEADDQEANEKYEKSVLNQALEAIPRKKPMQALDIGKKVMLKLNGFFSDPAKNQNALNNFCDFLSRKNGAAFNRNLYKLFREEVKEDPVTFNGFTIEFLSKIYANVKKAIPNADALADTLSSIITARFDKLETMVSTVEEKVDSLDVKIDAVPAKTFELLQTSGVLFMKEDYRECYNPSELPKYPEKLKKFVSENRADELRKALTYFENHRILFISGIGGVGKSTLARALIERRPTNVPEPFWFSFFDNQGAKLGDILEKLASYLNAPEIASFKNEKREPGKTDVDRLTGELNRRSEIWLIFDDLSIVLEDQHFADKGIEILFSSLRFNTYNAKVIATSRTLPILENGESLIDSNDDEEKQRLNGLRTNFAVDYLIKSGLGDLESDKLEELAKGVDGHPLALQLLVGLVKDFGSEDVLEDLSIYQEQKKDTILKARKLFDKLAGGEKGLLERISVYREPVGIKGIKEMFSEKNSLNSIKKLIDKSLLETDHKGKYWLHPLVREFSYEDLKNKKEAHLIAINYYKSLSLPENPTKKEDLQPAIEAHYHACEAEEYDLAVDIIWEFNLQDILDLWGYSRTLIEIYEKLLPKDHFKGEPILKKKQVHGVVLGHLGNAYINLSEPKKAIEYFEQALKISREIGDRWGKGADLGHLGNAYYMLGESKKAIEYYEQALQIAKEVEDMDAEGNWLGNLGNAYSHLGESKKAIEYFEQALQIAREKDNRRAEGIWLGNLGNAYYELGESKKAIEYFEQALKIAREKDNRLAEGNWLGNLGNAYSHLGEPGKAIEYYEQALQIAKEVEDRDSEGTWLGNLGYKYCILGESKKAIEYFEQALKIAREIGDRCNEGNWLGRLGYAYDIMGESKRAIEYFEQALKIAREIGDRRNEGNWLGHLGYVYDILREPKKAIEYNEQALKIAREIGDRHNVETWLGNLIHEYSILGEMDKAIEYLMQLEYCRRNR